MGLRRGKGPGLGPLATRFPQPERTLLHVLRAQAEDIGDQVWLRFDGGRELTFAEVLARANQVGAALVAEVGAGAHVALLLRNQDEFFPAFFGPMIARGVTVPLNGSYNDAMGRVVTGTSLTVGRADAYVLLGTGGC